MEGGGQREAHQGDTNGRLFQEGTGGRGRRFSECRGMQDESQGKERGMSVGCLPSTAARDQGKVPEDEIDYQCNSSWRTELCR